MCIYLFLCPSLLMNHSCLKNPLLLFSNYKYTAQSEGKEESKIPANNNLRLIVSSIKIQIR